MPDADYSLLPGRCASCAHWYATEYPIPLEVGDCHAVVQLWDASDWADDDDDDGDVRRVILPKYADRLAFVQDGSDYRAYLVTRPAFGCVQWSPRP